MNRYLRRMRIATINNFAMVAAKGFVRGNVPAWAGFEETILNAIEAVERYDVAYFRDRFIPQAIRIIDDANETELLRSLWLFARFPAIRARLTQTILDRIHALANSETTNVAVFAAVGLLGADVDAALAERFRGLEAADAVPLLEAFPHPIFMDPAIDALEHAKSFRAAEARLRNVEILAQYLDAAHMQRLLNAVTHNRQSSYAADTPSILARILDATIQTHDYTAVNFAAFAAEVQANQLHYDVVFDRLHAARLM